MKWEYVAGCLILILFTLIFIAANLSFFLFLLKILIFIVVLLLLLGLIINLLNPALFKKYEYFWLSTLKFINSRLEKTILFALSYLETPESIREISIFISKSINKQLNSIILKQLSRITEQSCIDEVCKIWADTRHQDLANLLVKKGWIASAPADIRVLSALKANKLDVVINGSEEIVEPLLNAFQDKDSEVANRASECAVSLKNLEVQEKLCRLVIEKDNQIASQVAIEAQYAPQEPKDRALFYLLTEQWDKYENLDFNQALLQKAHELANESLRIRIVSKLRQAGRVAILLV